MKKLFKRMLCGCMAAAVLCTTAFAQKLDLGAIPAGHAGLQGNTVMIKDGDNKVLSLESGKSEIWTFVNDTGTAVSFEQNIIVSAKYKGASMKLSSGGAEYTFAAADSWQTAQLVLYPRAKKYEVFIDDVYTTEGALAESAAVSQAVFTAVDGDILIDDLKVEQWDKTYDEVRDIDRIEAIFNDSFDTQETNGAIGNQTGWDSGSSWNGWLEKGEAETGYHMVLGHDSSTSKGSANAVINGLGEEDSAIISMNLMHPSTYGDGTVTQKKPQLNIGLANGSKSSLIKLFVEDDSGLYKYADGEIYRELWEDDEWFNLTVVMDGTARCYDLYVNDEKLNHEPVYWNTSNTGAFSYIQFSMNNNGNYGHWYVDDIKVLKILTTKKAYVPVVNETFDSWNPTAIDTAAADDYSTAVGEWAYGSVRKDLTTDIYPEYKVTTAEQAQTDNAEQTYGNFNNLTLGTNNYSSGNILEAKAEYQDSNAGYASGKADGTKAKNQSVVAHISDEGLTDNVRISADIYPVGYKQKATDTDGTTRDNLTITLFNDYQYSTLDLVEAKNDSYVGFTNGYASLLWSQAPWSQNTDLTYSSDPGWNNYFGLYDKGQWNHFEMLIDDGIVTATINGDTDVYTRTSEPAITEERTLKKDADGNYLPIRDIAIGFNAYSGGWFYLDNIKVEIFTETPIITDLSRGVRMTLVQNTVDEMYRVASAEDYTVEGLYYTKNNGATYESVPYHYAGFETDFNLGKAVIKNNTNENLTDAQVIAAVYNGGELADAAMKSVSINSGASAEVSFTDAALECAEENTVKLYIWNKGTLVPLRNSYDIPAKADDNRTKVFVAAASLSAPKTVSNYPEIGWGEIIGNYLDQQKVAVHNYAMGGRSTKSFYEEAGRWDAIKEAASKGDWVLISFAHNNSKDGEYYTNPYGDVNDETSCKHWLKKYYDDCKELGINMVLVTPIPRRYWSNNGKLVGSIGSGIALKPYIDAIREFAEEYDVPLVDTNTAMRQTVMEMGEEDSKELYMVWNVSDYADDPNFDVNYFAAQPGYESLWNEEKTTFTDNTHTRLAGAELTANAIAAGLSRIDGISEYVIK